MSVYCPKHPSDILFEDLTSDYKHIRHICLTCIAEDQVPSRIQRRQTAIEDARRNFRLVPLLRHAAKSTLAVSWIVILVVLSAAGRGIELGVGVLVLVFLWVIARKFEVLRQILRQVLSTPVPSVESVRKELESSYPRRAAAEVQRFKDNLRLRYEIEASGIAETDKMSGVQFEGFLADLLREKRLIVPTIPSRMQTKARSRICPNGFVDRERREIWSFY